MFRKTMILHHSGVIIKYTHMCTAGTKRLKYAQQLVTFRNLKDNQPAYLDDLLIRQNA